MIEAGELKVEERLTRFSLSLARLRSCEHYPCSRVVLVETEDWAFHSIAWQEIFLEIKKNLRNFKEILRRLHSQ